MGLEFTERQKRVLEEVISFFSNHESDGAHGLDHVLRVTYYAHVLSEMERADKEITVPAALLHDIAIPVAGDEEHARKGAEMCREILARCGYTKEEVDRISQAVLRHSIDDPTDPPATKEEKVLHDADKLDAVGCLGLQRIVVWCHEHGFERHSAPRWLEKHLKKTRALRGEEVFMTGAGKKLGAGRLAFLEEFARKWKEEAERIEKALPPEVQEHLRGRKGL